MELEDFIKSQVEELMRTIDAAEVLVVGFARFAERLLIDTRHNEQEPPIIQVVQPLNSADERLQELQRLRPNFPSAQELTFFMWPKSVKSFEEYGLWGRIRERVQVSANPAIVHELDVVWGILQQLEYAETKEAIAGANRYRSLWERKG